MAEVGFSREEQALRERAILPFLAACGFDRPLSREEVLLEARSSGLKGLGGPVRED